MARLPFSLGGMGSHLLPLILLTALLATGVTAEESVDQGKAECPCIAGDQELRQKLLPTLKRDGLPANYGMDGCAAYDKDSPSCNGQVTQPEWCGEKWCYVDREVCQVNKAKCTEAGGAVGSGVSPYCDTRQHHASHVIPNSTAPMYYSYSTCNSVNLYDAIEFGSNMAGTHMRATTLPSNPPFSVAPVDGYVDPRKPEWQGYEGLLVDILDYMRQGYTPPLLLGFTPGWSTQESRKRFSSSYTACVHDVIVGNWDLCLGDFWITPQRLDMMSKQPGQPAQFLIPFREDKIYLVAPSDEIPETFGQVMVKPFLPFKGDLWGLVIGFTIFSSIVSALIDKVNDTDYQNKNVGPRFFKSLYLHTFWFVSGGPLHYPVSAPSRMASLGFGLFTLITLATFTANLASLLVTKNLATGIASIDQAIELGLTICVPEAMAGQIMAEKPKGRYLQVAETQDVTGKMYRGECTVGVAHEMQVEMCMGGQCVEFDCNREDAGEAEVGSTGCVRNADGTPDSTRDCRFRKVGSPIMTIPLSMPINSEYAAGANKHLREYAAMGLYDKAWQDHEPKMLPTQCLPGVTGAGSRRSLTSPLPTLLDYAGFHPSSHSTQRRAGGAAASKSKGGGATGGGASAEAAGAEAATGNTNIENMRLDYTALLGIVCVSCVIYVVAIFFAVAESWFKKPIQAILGFDYVRDSEHHEAIHQAHEDDIIDIARKSSKSSERVDDRMHRSFPVDIESGSMQGNPASHPRALSISSKSLLTATEGGSEALFERLLAQQSNMQSKLDQLLTSPSSSHLKPDLCCPTDGLSAPLIGAGTHQGTPSTGPHWPKISDATPPPSSLVAAAKAGLATGSGGGDALQGGEVSHVELPTVPAFTTFAPRPQYPGLQSNRIPSFVGNLPTGGLAGGGPNPTGYPSVM